MYCPHDHGEEFWNNEWEFSYADCVVPLGMKSGRIEDSQITASDHTGKKAFHLKG